MAKRGRKKKNKIDINIAVVALVLLSILLMILIYTKSGSIGETLSPMLGGIMGFIKYIIPIGTLLIAIYMTQNDKEYMTHKLIQYGIFLLCVAAMLSIFQVGKGNLSIDKEFDKVIEDAYYLGEKDIGGGAIGAVVAVPLIKALGSTGAVILTIGIAVILLIFMFGIRPAEMISDLLDELRERKEEKKKEKKSKHSYDDTVIEEDTKGRKLREKEEAAKLASQFEDQLTININEKDNKDDKKKYNHNDLSIPFFGKKKEEPSSPDVIDANLFKQVEEQKEDKTKEVLQLEHTITEEDENYEFPPVQLLAEPEKKTSKGGKKAVMDTATKLQKTLYSFGVSAKVEMYLLVQQLPDMN